MIVLDLICDAGHRFEGWFASSEDFERQGERQLLACPCCNSPQVRRLPSAPHVQRGSNASPAVRDAVASLREALTALAGKSEDVGTRFIEEARRIHHGDAEARPIKGLASVRDTLELLEEGISVLPLPAAKEDLH